jgi:hypothetical protein
LERNGALAMKKKDKTTYDFIKQVRNSWDINPRTRVQDNDLKNKKKRRQDEKKLVDDGRVD